MHATYTLNDVKTWSSLIKEQYDHELSVTECVPTQAKDLPELVSAIQHLSETIIQQQKNITMLCNEVKDLKQHIEKQHGDLKDLRHVVTGTLPTPDSSLKGATQRKALSPPYNTVSSPQAPPQINAFSMLMSASCQAPLFQLKSMKGVEIQHALQYYKEYNLKDPKCFTSVIIDHNMRSKFKQVIVYALHFASLSSPDLVLEFLVTKRPNAAEAPATVTSYEKHLKTLIKSIDSLFMEELESIEKAKEGTNATGEIEKNGRGNRSSQKLKL
jgi:hypothetical protein